MTKPVPDKAEVALEYPDKFYVGTFERSSRFDAHLDATGISLALQSADPASRKSVHIHINYGLFADVLCELAKTVAVIPADDLLHREALAQGVQALQLALAQPHKKSAS